MTYTTPLQWMISLNPIERTNIISWFNSKMDTFLSNNTDIMRFNNPNNSITDIVNELSKIAIVEIAPESDSTEKEIEHFVSITENKYDIYNLTYNYCINKFDKL